MQVKIELTGTPQRSIPRLHSPDAAEQVRLDNHTGLIQTLGKRWTDKAAAYYNALVGRVNGIITTNPAKTINELVQERFEEHEEARGKIASAMIHSAVCRAVLDRRPEYLEEFAAPNATALD